MEIETIISGRLDNNTYIVKSGNKAIIIDAAASVDEIKKVLGNNEVVGVFLTHGHFDHISNLDNIIKAFNTKCFLNYNAIDKLYNPHTNCSEMFNFEHKSTLSSDSFVVVHDAEVFNILPKVIFVALYTPGHTDCGMTYVIDNCMFTGDLIFKRDIGRSDLPTSSRLDLQQSLAKIYKRKKNYLIYPGHGLSTTLDEERHK